MYGARPHSMDSLIRVAFDVGPMRAQPAGVGLYVASLGVALAEVLGPAGLAYIGHRPDAASLPTGILTLGRSARLPYPVWLELLAARDAKRAGAGLVHYTDGLVPPVRHGRTVLTIMDLSMVRHWRSHRVARYPRIPLVLAAPHLADLVVVPSLATADEVMRLARVPASKIVVIPLAARPDVGPTDPDTTAEVLARHGLAKSPYILALGTIEPRKNHLRLVQAFEQLVAGRRIGDDVVLAIAGKRGWGDVPVMEAIERSPARDRIRVLGYVSDDDLPALLTGAAVAAYVSLYEGFGLPVLEAMACGAVVVTSNVSSMPEVAGGHAILVDPLALEEIGRGIRDALALTPADRAAEKGRSIAWAARFTWNAVAQQTAAVYASVLADG